MITVASDSRPIPSNNLRKMYPSTGDSKRNSREEDRFSSITLKATLGTGHRAGQYPTRPARFFRGAQSPDETLSRPTGLPFSGERAEGGPDRFFPNIPIYQASPSSPLLCIGAELSVDMISRDGCSTLYSMKSADQPTALAMLKMGMYIAITRPPMTTPRKTMTIGSSMLVSVSTD